MERSAEWLRGEKAALAAAPSAKLSIIRVDLTENASGRYPLVLDLPVVCGDRVMEYGTDYYRNGAGMVVLCREQVYVFQPVAIDVIAPVQRRKP